jgi:hypothetical protein
VLARQIESIHGRYDPKVVFDSFMEHHPQFFDGDLDELKAFVDKVQTGQIHARLHEQHPTIEALANAIGL